MRTCRKTPAVFSIVLLMAFFQFIFAEGVGFEVGEVAGYKLLR
jgi:hypothetical protein